MAVKYYRIKLYRQQFSLSDNEKQKAILNNKIKQLIYWFTQSSKSSNLHSFSINPRMDLYFTKHYDNLSKTLYIMVDYL